MDLALTRNGDLLLEEVITQSHAISLNFFIKPHSQAIALTFDIEKFNDYANSLSMGIALNFDIKQHQEIYDVPVLEGEAELKQMCYNAIRSQLSCLKQNKNFGSLLYRYTNKKITKEMLKQLEDVAQDAISYFAPGAVIHVEANPSDQGRCLIVFDIEIMPHTLKLDYFI